MAIILNNAYLGENVLVSSQSANLCSPLVQQQQMVIEHQQILPAAIQMVQYASPLAYNLNAIQLL